MLLITPNERKVLLAIGIIVLAGGVLRFFNAASVRDHTLAGKVSRRVSLAVNVNNASPEQLRALPGIGAVIAQRIIDYRRRVGAFSRAQDLKKVNGIGEAKLARIKDYIRF